jgi:hypothetical protein
VNLKTEKQTKRKENKKNKRKNNSKIHTSRWAVFPLAGPLHPESRSSLTSMRASAGDLGPLLGLNCIRAHELSSGSLCSSPRRSGESPRACSLLCGPKPSSSPQAVTARCHHGANTSALGRVRALRYVSDSRGQIIRIALSLGTTGHSVHRNVGLARQLPYPPNLPRQRVVMV